MKTSVIERRAELLRLYTGLPWQSARRRVEAAEPGSLLIPQPDADQLLLEARVMAALAWRRITTVHPWGIGYVDPRSDRLLIRFEADPLERPAPNETQALDPEEWLRAADVQDQRMGTYGMTPCHRDLPARWHPAERPYRRPGRRGTAASAWLTSGLLRRVGLIRTLGVPLAVTGWLGHHARDGGERWIIDPTFAEGHGATGHRRLMALLAAPGWGLPVTPLDSHCNCHLPPEYSDQCTSITTGAAGRRGALEVRTIHRSGGRLKWIQQHRPTIYAAKQQLALSVPAWVEGWLEREDYRGVQA